MGAPGQCMTHNEEAEYNCGWCSVRICDACIDESGGKKYCTKCAQRFRIKPSRVIQSSQEVEKPRTMVVNLPKSSPPKKKNLFGF